jgi:hypothetical protein
MSSADKSRLATSGIARSLLLGRLSKAFDATIARQLPLWSFLLVLVIGALGSVLLAGAVRHQLTGGKLPEPLGRALMAVAAFPSLTKQVLTGAPSAKTSVADRFPGQYGLQRTAFIDDGYLLLAAVDSRSGRSTVRLVRLLDGAVMHSWVPNSEEIARRGPRTRHFVQRRLGRVFRAMAPLLMPDGGLVIHNQVGPIAKIDSCSKTQWVLDYPFHHSLSIDAAGNIWSPIIINRSSFDERTYPSFMDDGVAMLSPDGKLRYVKSVAEMLVEGGHQGLLFGAGSYDTDPVHLNKITPALASTPYWRKDDILLSLRHRSTVLLYRPGERRIVWLRTGPWLNQHDARFVGRSGVSVFGNDGIRMGPDAYRQMNNPELVVFPSGHSTIYVYDFATDRTMAPYDRLLDELELMADREGVSAILGNGDVFVEESMSGRLMRISTERVRWTYINREAATDDIHMLNWSRYLTPEEVTPILPRLRCRG